MKKGGREEAVLSEKGGQGRVGPEQVTFEQTPK